MDPVDISTPPSRAINTTSPLTGGGDLSADRTIAISTGTGAAYLILRTIAAGTGWEVAAFDDTLEKYFGSTRGRMLRRGSSGWEGFALGASATILGSDGTDATWRTMSAVLDAAIGSTRGAILYRGSGGWTKLDPVASGRVLTDNGVGADPSWTAVAASDAHPTPTNWGAEVTTMSATLTLDDTSDTVQMLDPNGAARVVVLPQPTGNNRYFVIVNADKAFDETAAGAFTLYIFQGIRFMCRIGPGKLRRFWSDGLTGWLAGAEETWAGWTGYTAYALLAGWGANSLDAGDYFVPWVVPSDSVAATNTLNSDKEILVPRDCTIAYATAGWSVGATATLALWRNGSLSGTTISIPNNTETDRIAVGLAVTAGDRLALEIDVDGGINDGWIDLWAAHPSVSDNRWVFAWGGDVAAANRWLECNRPPTTTTSSTRSGEGTDHVMPVDCTLTRVSWSSASGDNTTKIDVYKNGSLSYTETLTGAQGSKAAGSALALVTGDSLAFLHPSSGGGTVPGKTTLQVEVSGSVPGAEGYVLGCGQTSGAGGNDAAVHGNAATVGTGSPGGLHRHQMAQRCCVAGFSWFVTTASAQTYDLFKNGVLDQTVTLDATEKGGSAAVTRTSYYPGDSLSIERNGTTNGALQMAVLMANGGT